MIETNEVKSPDYRANVLTGFIPLIGIASGYIIHRIFDPLFRESTAGENWIMPARYSVGYTAVAPTYVLIAILQNWQHCGKIPLWRRLVDFIISGFLIGIGVIIGRLFGK